MAARAEDPDPPGYWQMGMPPTQAVEAINEQARELREDKRLWMEAEAGKVNGRYRYRQEAEGKEGRK